MSRLQFFATGPCQGYLVGRVIRQSVTKHQARRNNHQYTIKNKKALCPFPVNAMVFGIKIIR